MVSCRLTKKVQSAAFLNKVSAVGAGLEKQDEKDDLEERIAWMKENKEILLRLKTAMHTGVIYLLCDKSGRRRIPRCNNKMKTISQHLKKKTIKALNYRLDFQAVKNMLKKDKKVVDKVFLHVLAEEEKTPAPDCEFEDEFVEWSKGREELVGHRAQGLIFDDDSVAWEFCGPYRVGGSTKPPAMEHPAERTHIWHMYAGINIPFGDTGVQTCPADFKIVSPWSEKHAKIQVSKGLKVDLWDLFKDHEFFNYTKRACDLKKKRAVAAVDAEAHRLAAADFSEDTKTKEEADKPRLAVERPATFATPTPKKRKRAPKGSPAVRAGN